MAGGSRNWTLKCEWTGTGRGGRELSWITLPCSLASSDRPWRHQQALQAPLAQGSCGGHTPTWSDYLPDSDPKLISKLIVRPATVLWIYLVVWAVPNPGTAIRPSLFFLLGHHGVEYHVDEGSALLATLPCLVPGSPNPAAPWYQVSQQFKQIQVMWAYAVLSIPYQSYGIYLTL